MVWSVCVSPSLHALKAEPLDIVIYNDIMLCHRVMSVVPKDLEMQNAGSASKLGGFHFSMSLVSLGRVSTVGDK